MRLGKRTVTFFPPAATRWDNTLNEIAGLLEKSVTKDVNPGDTFPDRRSRAEVNLRSYIAEYEKLRSTKTRVEKQSHIQKNWQLVNVNGQYRLVRITYNEAGIYLGDWVNINSLIKSLKLIDFDQGGMIAVPNDGLQLSETRMQSPLVQKVKEQLKRNNPDYTLLTDSSSRIRYLTIMKKMAAADVNLTFVIPRKIGAFILNMRGSLC